MNQNNKSLFIYFQFFIFLLFLSTTEILSKEILDQWEDTTQTLFNPTDLEASSLNSLSIDNITNSILYLGASAQTQTEPSIPSFFLKTEKEVNRFANPLSYEISQLQSPLVTFNDALYFCSNSPYLIKLKLQENTIEKIPFPDSLNLNEASWNLKCYYHKNTQSIFIAMIGHNYLLSYKLSEEKWADKGESSRLYLGGGPIMSMNIYSPTSPPLLGIVHKSQEKIFLKILKYENDQYFQIHSFTLKDNNSEKYIEFYSKTEISFQSWDVVIIFTYEPNTNNFKFYHFERGQARMILFGGKNVLRFFNEYQINDVQFIENSAMLAYSLKSLKSDRYYIGVADLYYSIILYNIETLPQNKIFFNEGYLHKDQAFIGYFNDYQLKKICPFIYENNPSKKISTCKYKDENYKYFTINQKQEDNEIFSNSFSNECKDGKIVGSYCLLSSENCPVGYTDDKNQCKICSYQNYFNYGSKTCTNECDSKYQKEGKVCYDCEKENKIYYENDCIDSCSDVYGEEDPQDNTKCVTCKSKGQFYDNLTKKCISTCPDKSEKSDYSNECKTCSKYGQLYFRYGNKCVDKCPDYYVENSSTGECELCPEGTLFTRGAGCVKSSSCEDGYVLTETTVESNKKIKYCLYCQDVDKYFYEGKCHIQCPGRHQAFDEKNICYFCAEAGRDQSKKYWQDDTCVSACSPGYETFNEDPSFYCRNCLKENLFYTHDKKCSSVCEDYATYYKENNVCYFCNETDIGIYLEKDTCVNECSKGFILNEELKYCDFCHDHGLFYLDGKCQEKCTEYLGWDPDDNICTDCFKEKGLFFENDRCVAECDVTARKDPTKGICVHCPEQEKYYIEGKCAKNCPDFTLLNETNNLCFYCASDFSYLDYQCISSCGDPYISKDIDGHKVCALCEKETWYQGGKCVDTCEEGHSYALEEDGSCHFCYCGEKGQCEKFSSKCECEDEEHYFGHSCEFFSYQNINEKKVKIIAIDNSCIKSNTTLFGYEIVDKENFTKILGGGSEYSIKWGFYLGKEEISENKNYEKYFTTGNNEEIFGINGNLLSDTRRNNLTLSILDKNNKIVLFDVITISVQTINTLPEYKLNFPNNDITNYKPMEKILSIEQLKFDNHLQYKYDYQFASIDYFNEELPLTSFVSNKSIKTFAPFSKKFVMHLKNDRGEIISKSIDNSASSSTKNIENTMKISEIINYEKITNTEKIFKLMSYFYVNQLPMTDGEYTLLFNDFIEKRYKEIINKNGYYKEKTDMISRDRKMIVYSEPKILFSLINHILYNQKKYTEDIEPETINLILNTLKNIFDYSFDNITTADDNENNNNNESDSTEFINEYKAFSNSDLLSLLRTLDQALEINPEIGVKSNKKVGSELFYEILTDFSKYLSNKIYPGEAIKMKGKRISVFSYNFGKYQKLLSLPSFNFSKETDIDDFSTYDFEDYGPNQENCDVNSGKLLCIDKEYFEKFKNKLIEKKINISKLKLNLIMVKNLEKINKYSVNFNLYNAEDDSYINNLNEFDILFDIEFPLDNSNTNNNNKKSNMIKLDQENKEVFVEEDSPYSNNYSNITCVPKNYIKDSKYYCYTHFNYLTNSIRCTCNILDEITFIDDSDLANYYKNLQFSTIEYNYINYVSSSILYIISFLLFIPGIIYAITDIHKDNALIKKRLQNQKPKPQEYKREKYLEIKRFTNTGIFGFSFQLLFCKFPFFWACDIYNYFYPKYIRHFVVINGIFLGFMIALIPFYFLLPFIERQNFIDQRDTTVDDNKIHSINIINSYMIKATIFAFIGTVVTDLFIMFFGKALSYEEIETTHWKKIRNALRDYLYGKIKKKSLFGPNWKKLKQRMKAVYNLCGSYILKKNVIRHPNRNFTFENYLRFIKGRINGTGSNRLNNEADFLKKNKSGKSGNKEDLLCELTEGTNMNSSIDEIKTDNKKTGGYVPPNRQMIIKNLGGEGKFKMVIMDNFFLDGHSQNNSTNKEFSRMEKVRYKFMLSGNRNMNKNINNNGSKKNPKKEENKTGNLNINNININNSNNKKILPNQIDQNHLVYHAVNFSLFPVENYGLIQNSNISNENIQDKFKRYSLVTFILWVIFIVMFLISLVIVKVLLDGYEYFIIKTWLIPAVLLIIVGNFVFYYIKLLIGSILLFGFYHSRKKGCCLRVMFKIFVDKSMIYIYKTRNYISKYRRDYINI